MRVLKALGLGLLFALAFFGALAIAFNFLTESQGRTVGPFVSGILSVVVERAKKDLAETPDKDLEASSQDLSKKLYPVFKGAILGQVDSFVKDPQREQMRKKMQQAGKVFSEEVAAPFAHGVSQGSGKVTKELDSTLNHIREFTNKNKDLLNSLNSGLKALHGLAKEHPLPRPPSTPPFPGLPAQPPLSSPQGSSQDSYRTQ